jgi:hypothetical protein
MAPAELDLVLRTGDTEQITLALTNSGTPVNIAGRSYAAQVRSTALSSTILATFSCAITDAAGGIVVCTLSATQTASLTPTIAVWDLQETNGTAVTTLVGGTCTIESDVTRL